jgi:hypothetical protein
MNWRNYVKYRANKVEIKEHMGSVSASLLARRVLREWFEASSNNLPARIFANKLTLITDKLLKMKALSLINIYGYRQQYLSEGLEDL